MSLRISIVCALVHASTMAAVGQGGLAQTPEELQQAGIEACQRGDLPGAIALFDECLSSVDSATEPARHAELLLGQAYAMGNVGTDSAKREAVTRLRRCAEVASRLPKADAAYERLFHAIGMAGAGYDLPERADWIRNCVESMELRSSGDQRLISIYLDCAGASDGEDARRYMDRALELLGRYEPDTPQMRHALRLRAGLLLGMKLDQEGLADLGRALSGARALVPDSLELADTLGDVINAGRSGPDRWLEEPKALYTELIELTRKAVPESPQLVDRLRSIAHWLSETPLPAPHTDDGRALVLELLYEALAVGKRVAPETDSLLWAYARLAFTEGVPPEDGFRYWSEGLALHRRLHPGGDRGWFYFNTRTRPGADQAEVIEFWRQQLSAEVMVAPESVSVSHAHWRLGTALREAGELPSALAEFLQAVAYWDHADRANQIPPGWRQALAELLMQAGRFDEAVGQLMQEAARGQDNLAPGWEVLADASLLSDLATAHDGLGHRAEAREYRYFAAVRQAAQASDESVGSAKLIQALGEAAYRTGRLREARTQLERAMGLWRKLSPLTPEAAACLESLALVRWRQGDLEEALVYLQEVLDFREQTAPDSLLVARTLGEVALVQLDRGEVTAARALLSRSLDLMRKRAPDSRDLADLLNSTGIACTRAGDLDSAVAAYTEALALAEKLAPGSPDLAYAHNNLGATYLRQQRYPEAAAEFERSRAILTAVVPTSLDVAIVLANLGEAKRLLGNLSEARECLVSAQKIADTIAPLAATIGLIRDRLGRVAEAEGNLPEARDHYWAAITSVERTREAAGSGGLERTRFLTPFSPFYHDLIRVQEALGDIAGAADTAERLRARALLEMVGERRAGLGSGSMPSELRAELEEQRALLEGELRSATGERAAQLGAQLAELDLKEEQLARATRMDDPRFAALVYPEPLPLDQLRPRVAEGTLVLQYVVAEEATHLFAFGRDLAPRHYEVAIPARTVRDSARELVSALRSRSSEALAVASSLGRVLLGPVAAEVRSAVRLEIQPDDVLWSVPFAALEIEPGLRLADVVPLSYAASSTVAVTGGRTSPASPRRGLAAFGDPDFSRLGSAVPSDDPDVIERSAVALRTVGGPSGLPRLPFTGVEVGAVSAIWGDEADVRTGRDATEAALRGDALTHRVLHLATHGIVDAERPLASAVALALPERPAEGDDGLLTAREVLSLDLSGCDLVVLSACDTARGEVLSGEGVVGLSRAFQAAGAASVVCSQWPVSDMSTAALMVRFHAHYRQGDAKDVALAKAMREVRTGTTDDGSPLNLPQPLEWSPKWDHPSYWAAFVLLGAP